MNRGEVKIDDRVRVPGWVLSDTEHRKVTTYVVAFASRWRGEVNVVEVEYKGGRKRVNVCYLEPAP